jgi:hypothetical protein
MRLFPLSALVSLSISAAAVYAAPPGTPGTPGSESNATSSGPNMQGNAGNQREAEASFARARAECRGAERGTKLDCVARAQQDIDKTQRVMKPPRKPPPDTATPAVKG